MQTKCVCVRADRMERCSERIMKESWIECVMSDDAYAIQGSEHKLAEYVGCLATAQRESQFMVWQGIFCHYLCDEYLLFVCALYANDDSSFAPDLNITHGTQPTELEGHRFYYKSLPFPCVEYIGDRKWWPGNGSRRPTDHLAYLFAKKLLNLYAEKSK